MNINVLKMIKDNCDIYMYIVEVIYYSNNTMIVSTPMNQ